MNSSQEQSDSSSQKSSSKRKLNFSRFFVCPLRQKKLKRQEKAGDQIAAIDKKLVYSLSPQKIPSWRQLRYSKKVLNHREKSIIKVVLLALIVVLLVWIFRFYQKHLVIYPSFGGEYSEGMIGAPKNINPLYDFTRDVDSDISRLIYSSLFKRSKNGELLKDLVEDYSISEDGLEYSFKIREDVKWHHAEDLNSEDVIFTVAAIKNADYGSPLRTLFSEVEIEKIDDYNFKFILHESYSGFLDLLTFGILPKNLWMNISPANAFLNELNIKPIGSGPYKFKSLSKNKAGDIKEFVLVANNDYYAGVPYINKIILKFYNNYGELVSALNNNQVNGLSYLPYALKSDLVSKSSLRFNNLDLPQITSIFYNSKNNSLLSSKKNRQILTQLIDKNKICNEIFLGNAQEAFGPILPSSPSYNNELEFLVYDYESAIEALEEGSWSKIELKAEEINILLDTVNIEEEKKEIEEKMSALLENSELDNFEELKSQQEALLDEINSRDERLSEIDDLAVKKAIVHDYSAEGDISGLWLYKKSSDSSKSYDFLTVNLTTIDLIDNLAVAEFIKYSWEKAGVKTFLRVISPNQLQSEIIKQRNFEALLLSQVLSSDQDTYSFWHSSQSAEGGLNISAYKNKEVDKLLATARLELDLEKRIENYKKFQELINEDLPITFLYFPSYTYVHNKKIKGFDFKSLLSPADRFNQVAEWYIKVKRKLEF